MRRHSNSLKLPNKSLGFCSYDPVGFLRYQLVLVGGLSSVKNLHSPIGLGGLLHASCSFRIRQGNPLINETSHSLSERERNILIESSGPSIEKLIFISNGFPLVTLSNKLSSAMSCWSGVPLEFLLSFIKNKWFRRGKPFRRVSSRLHSLFNASEPGSSRQSIVPMYILIFSGFFYFCWRI